MHSKTYVMTTALGEESEESEAQSKDSEVTSGEVSQPQHVESGEVDLQNHANHWKTH